MNRTRRSFPRLASILALVTLALSGLYAQAAEADEEAAAQAQSQALPAGKIADFPGAIRSLDLSGAELDKVEAYVMDALKLIRPADAEIEVVKAQVTQALLKPGVALKDLEPLVRDSTEQTYKIRMAQLDRQLKIRALIGDKRWAILARLSRLYAQAEKNGRLRALEAANSSNGRTLNVLKMMNAR